jgi:DNA-binding NarL/FixJ family response regulator
MSSDAAVALALAVPTAGPEIGPEIGPAEAGDAERHSAPPGGLTTRERQIAALVASGRSNRAIAEELYISPATAARHVANILLKLGFTSRVQIAAWVAGQR